MSDTFKDPEIMIEKKCTFEMDRLFVEQWHSFEFHQLQERDLESILADMLTEPVTRLLPPEWRGAYTVERARMWIRDRDNEGTNLLVIEKSTKEPIGLMILFASKEGADVEMRIGFLFAESSWGKGFGTELLGGFIDWCRGQPMIKSIAGGVAPGNVASKRVMEKLGFVLVEGDSGASSEDELFRLQLRD